MSRVDKRDVLAGQERVRKGPLDREERAETGLRQTGPRSGYSLCQRPPALCGGDPWASRAYLDNLRVWCVGVWAVEKTPTARRGVRERGRR